MISEAMMNLQLEAMDLQEEYNRGEIDNIEFSRRMSDIMARQEESLSAEEKFMLRKTMMDTQDKVKPPKRAFHGTSLKRAESIDEQGILAHRVYGEIYFCDSLENVLKFIASPCVVYEVDTKKLLPKRWRLSKDHSKAVYGCEAYCYFGDVPPSAFKEKHIVKGN
jgi:hypothetical protein